MSAELLNNATFLGRQSILDYEKLPASPSTARTYRQETLMKMDLVRDWMTPAPLCVLPHTTLPEALKLMQDRKIRRLPVVDDKSRILGIVTRGDLRGAQPSQATSLSIYELNYLLSRLTMDKLMTTRVFTVTPMSTIGDAARLMLKHKIAGLPVVEAGRVVGILTESDIFRLVVRMWETEPEPERQFAGH